MHAEGRTEVLFDKHLRWGAVCDNATIEQDHPITSASLRKVVGRDHDDSTVRCFLIDHVENRVLAREIKARDRLIEK